MSYAQSSSVLRYQQKRIQHLKDQMKQINDGTHVSMVGKLKEATKKRDLELARIARKKEWHERAVEVTLQKDLDDARYEKNQEAKRQKEILHAKLCDDIDALKREMNVWDGPDASDTIALLGRKLRTRGADGKAAETANQKKRKRDQWNQGYVFGAHLAVKFGFRVEGDDKVTLPASSSSMDVYEINKAWESLNRRTKFGLKGSANEPTPERRSVRRSRYGEDDDD